MAINTQALGSTFTIAPVAKRQQQAEFKNWQAVFFTLRSLLWQASKSQVFKDAIEKGILEPIAPGQRQKDGSYSRSEYDSEVIKEVYSEAWEEFHVNFDAAFTSATREEMLDYALTHFNMNEQQIVALNRQRMAERFNRTSEERYS